MRRLFLLLLVSSVALVCRAQTYTVESVPNMKLIGNNYVSNPDNLINETTVAQINQQLSALEQQTTSQVAVVLLNSIGEETDFDFAQNLFKRWGIGMANKDNGLLILFINDQRKIRLHTGFGLEGILPDAICKQIQIQKMVPYFKEGNVNQGILAGVEEVIKILTDPKYAEEIRDDNSSSDMPDQAVISFWGAIGWVVIGLIIYFSRRKSGFSDSPNATHNLPTAKISSGQWWAWDYLFPIATLVGLGYVDNWLTFFVGVYAFFILQGLNKYGRITREANTWLARKDYHVVHNFLSEQKKGIRGMAFLFPAPFIFIWMLLKRKIGTIRTTPRDCKNCGKKCVRLDEVAEDEYLSKESQFEEQLKSIDYDIWKCNDCGETSIEAYINEKTEYTECPKCKTYAFHKVSATTKVAATTSHSGSMEVVKSCKFCNHRVVTTESIPMIETSSSSDSSSSSSDSGGSYGGGDSGGGGASSSW